MYENRKVSDQAGDKTAEVKKGQLAGSLLLFLTAFIWGTSFVAQSIGMNYIGPWTFIAVRSLIAGVILLPVALVIDRKLLKEKSRSYPEAGSKTLKAGLICGGLLCAASVLQTVGIKYTTAGKAGFITALYVLLVPVFGMFIGKKSGLRIWLCVLTGVTGLYFISVNEEFTVGYGDLLVMACAVVYSIHIMYVDHTAPGIRNLVKMSCIQFLVASALSFAGAFIFEKPDIMMIRVVAGALLYSGALSGAVGYTLQIVGQKNTNPAVASLIMSLESVFSVLADWVVLKQTMTLREIFGCTLMFIAVVVLLVTGSARKADGG